MIIPFLALTQVMTAGAWTLTGLESEINAKLKALEESAAYEKRALVIKSITSQTGYSDTGYSAIIVYEIKDKTQ